MELVVREWMWYKIVGSHKSPLIATPYLHQIPTGARGNKPLNMDSP